MRLIDLLSCGIEFSSGSDFAEDTNITGLTEDSRQVKKGFIFAAVRGGKVDGTEYISQAVKNGTAAILTYPDIKIKENTALITHDNPRLALGHLAAKFYGKAPETIAAVTGTNGKTSVVNFVRQIWHYLGKKSASIGTIGIIENGGEPKPAGFSMTTPGVVELHQAISELARGGVTHLALEASSHGLDQSRLAGVKIGIGAFTNITRDHLDYHGDMENYLQAKLKLFTENMQQGGVAVLNADITEFAKIEKVCKEQKHKIISFGRKGGDIKLRGSEAVTDGLQMKLEIAGKKGEIKLNLFGEFQESNVLCAAGIALASGCKAEDIIGVLEKSKPIKGRMEKVGSGNIFVDYAHTPDGLDNALSSIRKHMPEGTKLAVVFGCGGNRDKGKRPMMGNIAAENADIIVVTDDNPRNEDAATIRSEIIAACPGAKEIADRKEAIKYAIDNIAAGDFLVIAGKGHEAVQIVGDRQDYFSDVEVVREFT